MSPAQLPFISLCSSFTTTQTTSSLLSRPPRFVPTPSKCPHLSIRFFVKDFIRKVQWRSLLHGNTKKSRFTIRSSRHPPIARIDSGLIKRCHKLLAAVNTTLRNCSSCYSRPNLTTNEAKELQRLQQDPSLTVAPADKGGKWVLLSSD